MWVLASASQITWAGPPRTLLNTDGHLHRAQQGSGFLLAIFTKVCFFPSLHSRVYPEWFNYNFPCVRQIKEESRSVVPSTLFISLTDCSSPNPRATAAAAAQRLQNVRGKQEWEDGGFQMAWRYVSQVRALHIPRLKKNSLSFSLQPILTHNTPRSFQENNPLKAAHWGRSLPGWITMHGGKASCLCGYCSWRWGEKSIPWQSQESL